MMHCMLVCGKGLGSTAPTAVAPPIPSLVAAKVAARAGTPNAFSTSGNVERLNFANGLLLTATLYTRFDAGLVAFADSGTMLVSAMVPREPRDARGAPCWLTAVSTPPAERSPRYFGKNCSAIATPVLRADTASTDQTSAGCA